MINFGDDVRSARYLVDGAFTTLPEFRSEVNRLPLFVKDGWHIAEFGSLFDLRKGNWQACSQDEARIIIRVILNTLGG